MLCCKSNSSLTSKSLPIRNSSSKGGWLTRNEYVQRKGANELSFLKATAATLLVTFLILAIYAFRSEGDSVTPVTGILFLFTVYMIPFAVIWSLIGEGSIG